MRDLNFNCNFHAKLSKPLSRWESTLMCLCCHNSWKVLTMPIMQTSPKMYEAHSWITRKIFMIQPNVCIIVIITILIYLFIFKAALTSLILISACASFNSPCSFPSWITIITCERLENLKSARLFLKSQAFNNYCLYGVAQVFIYVNM